MHCVHAPTSSANTVLPACHPNTRGRRTPEGCVSRRCGGGVCLVSVWYVVCVACVPHVWYVWSVLSLGVAHVRLCAGMKWGLCSKHKLSLTCFGSPAFTLQVKYILRQSP